MRRRSSFEVTLDLHLRAKKAKKKKRQVPRNVDRAEADEAEKLSGYGLKTSTISVDADDDHDHAAAAEIYYNVTSKTEDSKDFFGKPRKRRPENKKNQEI